MHPKITNKIWADSNFIELDDKGKLAVFWLITNANYAGYVEVTEKRLKRDLEIDINILDEACGQMGDNFVRTDRGLWLRNYIRRQVGDGVSLQRNNIAKTVLKHLEQDSPEELKSMVYEEYTQLEALGKDLGSPWEGLSKEKEKEREKDLEIVEGADEEYERMMRDPFGLND